MTFNIIKNKNHFIDIVLPNGQIITTDFFQIIVWADSDFCLGKKLGSEFLYLITQEGEIMDREIIKRFSNGFFATHDYYNYIDKFKDHDNHYEGYNSKILNQKLNIILSFPDIPNYGDFQDGKLLINENLIIDDTGRKIYTGPKDIVGVVWNLLKVNTYSVEERTSKYACEIVVDLWSKQFLNFTYLYQIVDTLILQSKNLEEFYLHLKYLKRFCSLNTNLRIEADYIFYYFDLIIILQLLISKFEIKDKIDYWDTYNERLQLTESFSSLFNLFEETSSLNVEREKTITEIILDKIKCFKNIFRTNEWTQILDNFNFKHKIIKNRDGLTIKKNGFENKSNFNVSEFLNFLSK